MPNKRLPAVHARAQRARRVARPPVVGTAVRVHPRLLRGFLVRLDKVPTLVRGRTRAKGLATGIRRGHAGRFAPSSNEGPSDDATFH